MRATQLLNIFTIAAALTAGCGGSTPQAESTQTAAPATTDTPESEAAPMASMCPMKVEGVAVKAEDTENGIALAFRSSPESVDELRQRVQRMAAMGCKHAAKGMHGNKEGKGMHGKMHGDKEGKGMHGKMHGDKEGKGMHGKMHADKKSGAGEKGMMGKHAMVPAEKMFEEIDSGARLVFTPKDPTQLEELRADVRRRAERMAAGNCPMMSKNKPTSEGEVATDEQGPEHNHEGGE
tara:strand:+ start:108310 stop:109017 length:708 start_codon:yes stop_codon:yes gene_type:complete